MTNIIKPHHSQLATVRLQDSMTLTFKAMKCSNKLHGWRAVHNVQDAVVTNLLDTSLRSACAAQSAINQLASSQKTRVMTLLRRKMAIQSPTVTVWKMLEDTEAPSVELSHSADALRAATQRYHNEMARMKEFDEFLQQTRKSLKPNRKKN